MPASRVLFALTGDARRNSRALKQIRTLVELGCTVEVLCVRGGPGSWRFDERVRLRLVDRPPGRGPLFFWRVHRLMARAAAEITADVYHASDLYVLPALASASRRRRSPLVFDAREMYPHVASTQGRPGATLFWHALQQRFLPRCSTVFTVSDSIAAWLGDTYGVDAIVLHNVPERQAVAPSRALRDRLGLPDETVVVLHQGKMQKDRGCRALLEAAPRLNGAVVVFLGDGPLRPSLEARTEELGVDAHVYFLDPVPPDQLLHYTASADIGVTLLEDTCLNHRYALPNKLFEYLMAGIPVLASDLPEISKVVRTYGVGLVVDPARPESVRAGLQQMIDQPDTRKRCSEHAADVLETFSWESASERMRHAYRLLLTNPRP